MGAEGRSRAGRESKRHPGDRDKTASRGSGPARNHLPGVWYRAPYGRHGGARGPAAGALRDCAPVRDRLRPLNPPAGASLVPDAERPAAVGRLAEAATGPGLSNAGTRGPRVIPRRSTSLARRAARYTIPPAFAQRRSHKLRAEAQTESGLRRGHLERAPCSSSTVMLDRSQSARQSKTPRFG
jgi:hypothetical protein